MWRMYCYRTTEPARAPAEVCPSVISPTASSTIQPVEYVSKNCRITTQVTVGQCTLEAFGRWTDTKIDELTGQELGDTTRELANVSLSVIVWVVLSSLNLIDAYCFVLIECLAHVPAADAIEVWDAMLTYAAGLSPRAVETPGNGAVSALLQGLRAVGEQAEPQRVGSAYALAKAGKIDALCHGLESDRENVRRAAAYGLATLSGRLAETAVPPLLALCESAAKSTRKFLLHAISLLSCR